MAFAPRVQCLYRRQHHRSTRSGWCTLRTQSTNTAPLCLCCCARGHQLAGQRPGSVIRSCRAAQIRHWPRSRRTFQRKRPRRLQFRPWLFQCARQTAAARRFRRWRPCLRSPFHRVVPRAQQDPQAQPGHCHRFVPQVLAYRPRHASLGRLAAKYEELQLAACRAVAILRPAKTARDAACACVETFDKIAQSRVGNRHVACAI